MVCNQGIRTHMAAVDVDCLPDSGSMSKARLRTENPTWRDGEEVVVQEEAEERQYYMDSHLDCLGGKTEAVEVVVED